MKAILVLLINADKTCAVVVWYDDTKHDAPMLIAKAKNSEVQNLFEFARLKGICILENSRVCEALYESADLHASIPEELFAGVAEILADTIKSDCTKAVITETLLSETITACRG